MDASQGNSEVDQPPATRRYVVVFDVNDTLGKRNYFSAGKVESISKNHPECQVIKESFNNERVFEYVFLPHLRILFDYLLEKGVRIVFFPYFDKEKSSNGIIPELLSSIWGREKFEVLKSGGQFAIFSRENMRKGNSFTGEGNYVKDLKVVIRDGESLSDVILVEDDRSFIAHDQKPFVHVLGSMNKFLYEEEPDDFGKNSIYYMIGIFMTYFENEKYNKLPLREGLRQILPADIVWLKEHPFARNMIDVGLSFVRKVEPNALFYGLKYPQLYQYAVKNGHSEIVGLLVNSRLTTNVRGVERNLCAQEKKCVEFVQWLLASGVVIKEVPELLHLAADDGFFEVFKLLVENGADVNALSSHGDTPLYLSCGWTYGMEKERKQKKDMIVKLLLDSGADINIQKPRNEKSYTAFHHAAFCGRKDAVCLFLSCGVDVNLRTEDGATPLHLACKYRSREIVEILLKHKANATLRQKNGETPVHCTDDAEIMKLLLRFGADIDARGPKNRTAFHYAFPRGSDAVSILLDSGCDFDAKADCEGSVLDVVLSEARSEYSFDIVNRRNFPCDFLTERTHQMVGVLKRHVIKLEAAGLYVGGENINRFNCSQCDPSDFRLNCKEEIEQMINEQVYPQFTLFDVLANFQNPCFARNKSLMQILKNFNFGKFPIYESLIVCSLQRIEAKFELLNAGVKTLNVLVKTSTILNGEESVILPADILESIILYLDHSEIKNLISCGEALKRQVKCQ